MVEFIVRQGDVTQTPSDLLLLKYAQAYYGADKRVASLLTSKGLCSTSEISPSPGDCAIVETKGVIAPRRVMFLGTERLGQFGYGQMREFARRALEIVGQRQLPVELLTATIHGAGYGLDASESLQNLVVGFIDGSIRQGLKGAMRVTFVEKRSRRARVLESALRDIEPIIRGNRPSVDSSPPVPRTRGARAPEPRQTQPIPAPSPEPAAPRLPKKERIFVAMPFAEEFQDVYQFGIYEPVRQCGYICERVDEASFVGDVLRQIHDGIRNAKLVIADLSGARPNVYLEVGYALGQDVPVLFLARHGEPLHFDVSTQRCIYYKTIIQLRSDLEKLIHDLYGPGDTPGRP